MPAKPRDPGVTQIGDTKFIAAVKAGTRVCTFRGVLVVCEPGEPPKMLEGDKLVPILPVCL